jgi:lysophospholipase L1-like esterase
MRLSRGRPDIAVRALETSPVAKFPRLDHFRSMRTLISPPPLLCVAVLVVVALLAGASGAARAQAPEPAPAVEPPPAPAVEPATGVVITWEVMNRFRLFRDDRDFRRHVEAESGRSVFEAEEDLAEATEGRGWARDMVVRLCLDAVGRVTEQCLRDGVRENYLAPADHRVEVRLEGRVPAGAACSWTFSDGDAKPLTLASDCSKAVSVRPRYGRTTMAAVDIAAPDEPVRRANGEIAVRDLLIAGLGDSVASGDGNPDRPVVIADEGFCFRRFGPAARPEYFRPGRVGFRGSRACESGSRDDEREEWALLSARWMSGACHRSLYGHQLRAALALAVERPHMAVTFLPLACTGATIDIGLLDRQPSREINCGSGAACPRTSPAQVTQLLDLVVRAQRTQPGRTLDLVFLTIGANDINFPGLFAGIIIEQPAERRLFQSVGIISTVEASQATLERKLPGDFARLRAALEPLVNNMFERVVFVSYGNPALAANGKPCPGGRAGFDVNPSFNVGAEVLARTAAFVQQKFLPALERIANCDAVGACADRSESMTFVDAHQAAFAEHGFCARAESDPPFDRECFLADGTSFDDGLVTGAHQPLACGVAVSEFRAYAPRARWIRTANDSYFAAMTFPEGVSAALQPSDLHDSTWGILSAVYGGAIHPTAEGHAAMADAALEGARKALHLAPPDAPVTSEPLPPVAPLPP